jgi:predicted outer membrane repeat protein
VTIADSVLTGNYSESRGGAFYATDGTVTVTNSVFSNNVADEDGGAVGIFSTQGEATDVVISDSVPGTAAPEALFGLDGNDTLSGAKRQDLGQLREGGREGLISATSGGLSLVATNTC